MNASRHHAHPEVRKLVDEVATITWTRDGKMVPGRSIKLYICQYRDDPEPFVRLVDAAGAQLDGVGVAVLARALTETGNLLAAERHGRPGGDQ